VQRHLWQMYGVAYSKISCLDHTLWSDVWQLLITGVEIIQRLSNTTQYFSYLIFSTLSGIVDGCVGRNMLY